MQEKLQKKTWVAIVVFSLLGQIAWTMENMLLNVFISGRFNATLQDIALMVSLSAVVAALTTLFIGVLSDKVGKRKIFIVGGYIAWGISIVAFTFLRVDFLANLFPYANVLSLGISLTIVLDCIMTFFGSSANDACFNAYLTDISDDTNRGKIEGINSAMPLISVLVVFGLFQGFTAQDQWEVVFLGIGGLVLVCGLFGLFFISDSKTLQKKEGAYFKDIFHGFKGSVIKNNAPLYLTLLTFCIFSISIQVFMPYLILYFTNTLKMANYVLVFAPAIIIAAIATIFFGRLYDAKGFIKTIFITMAVFVVGLLILTIFKTTLLVFIGCALMMIGWLTSLAAYNASIRQYTPKKEAGLYQGVRIFMGVLIPMLIGPWIGSFVSGKGAGIGGTVGDDYNPNNLIFLAAIAVVILAFIGCLIIKKKVYSKRQVLTSKYHDELNKEVHLEECSRSKLKREAYLCLNTTWELAFSSDGQFPTTYPYQIKIPYCVESRASMVHKELKKGECLFYRYQFKLDKDFLKERVILHFDGVDNECLVYLNGELLTRHFGGYQPFSLEIKDKLKDSNELIVQVYDDLDYLYPYGKQANKSKGMWYTKVSGIYKSVWLEAVATKAIERVNFKVDIDKQRVEVNLAGDESEKTILVKFLDKEVHHAKFRGNKYAFQLADMQLWDVDHPQLYEVIIKNEFDEVKTYFACREVKIVGNKFVLNNSSLFINGLLYQPYFCEGLLTPESYKVFEDDILLAKKLGFNTLRVHLKVEAEIFYELCDRLGMMVIQDMVNNFKYSYLLDTVLPTLGKKTSKEKRHNNLEGQGIFINQVVSTIKQLDFYPCIIMWNIFNEGWGQFDSKGLYELVKQLDNTRLIDTASGWFDNGYNEIDSRHIYFKPIEFEKVGERPLFISECGGFSYKIKDNSYNLHNTYGYRFYNDQVSFEKGLIDLYEKEIKPGIAKGLAGVIYTELNDVEDETNGLITYDRKVIKVDVEKVGRAITNAIKLK